MWIIGVGQGAPKVVIIYQGGKKFLFSIVLCGGLGRLIDSNWAKLYQWMFGVCAQITSKQHEELRMVREHIRDCFQSISCYLMPSPGSKVQSGESNGKLAGKGSSPSSVFFIVLFFLIFIPSSCISIPPLLL